ncbi:MAG: guanylate kinase [Clostridia bacterium]|nr:guanylate kinase [Clostridia bacterium]
MGTLFVISGPAGVGKGTLVNLLIEDDKSLALSVSCTTRSPRVGEVNGKSYFFISKEEFLQRKEEGDFLEWDEHFGNYYGTPKSFVLEQLKTHSVILEIDVKGAAEVREALKGKGVKPVLIMIAPPSEEILEKRLSGRASESEEEILNRLKRAEYELSKKDEYDYTVVNDDLNEAKETLKKIIETEKSKRRF